MSTKTAPEGFPVANQGCESANQGTVRNEASSVHSYFKLFQGSQARIESRVFIET